ncbi:hypothetical protein GCM10028807_58030 [Spirosoma daeguense]
MHLRYSLDGAPLKHAQHVMRDLGITYQHATPQSVASQWWFWNCENVPDELPEYLSELKLNPIEQIGKSLTKEQAERICNYKNE